MVVPQTICHTKNGSRSGNVKQNTWVFGIESAAKRHNWYWLRDAKFHQLALLPSPPWDFKVCLFLWVLLPITKTNAGWFGCDHLQKLPMNLLWWSFRLEPTDIEFAVHDCQFGRGALLLLHGNVKALKNRFWQSGIRAFVFVSNSGLKCHGN